MTLKDQIIEKFLLDDRQNYAVYGTDKAELSRLYDTFLEYSKLPQKDWFTRLLVEQKAMTIDGRIRFDREANYQDKESKKTEKVKVVFKYAVFNYFLPRWQDAMAEIKKREKEALKTL